MVGDRLGHMRTSGTLAWYKREETVSVCRVFAEFFSASPRGPLRSGDRTLSLEASLP